MHNPFRACLVLPDGHMVLWDYKHAPFLAAMNPLVAELRSGAAFIYSLTGERTDEAAAAFAAELADVLAAHAGRNRRLAVDKIMLAGFRALAARGLAVEDGEPLTERARAVKGPDEIRAMRCALARLRGRDGRDARRRPPRPLRGRDLGAPPRRQHPPRRRVDRDPPPRLRPAHQPLVPGMRPPHRPGGRDPRLRHRPRRPLRLLRRHLPHLVDRRRRPAPRHASPTTASPASRSPPTPRSSAPAPASPTCTTAPSSSPTPTAPSATPASSTASASATNGPTSPTPRTACPAPSRACSSPAWSSASRA